MPGIKYQTRKFNAAFEDVKSETAELIFMQPSSFKMPNLTHLAF